MAYLLASQLEVPMMNGREELISRRWNKSRAELSQQWPASLLRCSYRSGCHWQIVRADLGLDVRKAPAVREQYERVWRVQTVGEKSIKGTLDRSGLSQKTARMCRNQTRLLTTEPGIDQSAAQARIDKGLVSRLLLLSLNRLLESQQIGGYVAD